MNNIYLILILIILFINIIQFINFKNNQTIAKTIPLISKHYEWYGTNVSNNKYEIIPDNTIKISDLDLRNKNLTHEVFGYILYTDVVSNKITTDILIRGLNDKTNYRKINSKSNIL